MRSLLAALLLVIAPAAQAASILAWDVPTLTEQSDAVVRAKVVSSRSGLDDRGNIATWHRLEVREAWKGALSGAVEVVQAGGRFDGKTARIDGDYRLEGGQDVVMFLRRVDGVWYGTLLGWGVFHVDGDRVVRDGDGLNLMVMGPSGGLEQATKADRLGPETVAALKAAVQKAVAR